MDDIRDWHFNAGYDKTLITGKQLIDSEGKLRDILSNYSVGNPGVTGQEVITPVRVGDDKPVYGADHTPPYPVDTGTASITPEVADSNSPTPPQVTDASTSTMSGVMVTDSGTNPSSDPEAIEESNSPGPAAPEVTGDNSPTRVAPEDLVTTLTTDSKQIDSEGKAVNILSNYSYSAGSPGLEKQGVKTPVSDEDKGSGYGSDVPPHSSPVDTGTASITPEVADSNSPTPPQVTDASTSTMSGVMVTDSGTNPSSDPEAIEESNSPGPAAPERSIRSVRVLDIKIRGLLKSDHFRDVEKALNSGGDIRADRRKLQPDRDEVENILKEIQTKSAKKEVDLDADFSIKLEKHLNDLKTIDLSSPKKLAQIIVSSMDDIRDWHFNAGYDKTLITGKQLIDSEGRLGDILSNYSVGNPGVTKQEVIAPVRGEVSGDESHPVTPASADGQTISAVHSGTALTRPDGEKTPAISDDTLISPNGHKMPAVTYKATDEGGESGYGSDVTSSVSPVDKKTEKIPVSEARVVSNTGTQTLPVPDNSPRLMPEGTGTSPVGDEAKESGDGSDATSPKSPVDKGTETSPTSSARGVSTTGTQTLPVSDSPGPMPEETGKSPDVNETRKSDDSSDVASLLSPADQGTETSSTSSARRASTTGTQTVSDNSMTERTGNSPVGDEAKESGDGSDVDSLSSPDDHGAETSSTSSARRASSAGTQTDPDNSMTEGTGDSPVGDKAKESGDGFDIASPASLVDQGTETSPTLEALGASSTGSQTSSVTDSPRSMPEETGKSPVGDKAGKSGDGSDVASLLSPVDQETETSPTSEAPGAFITGSQTTSVPDSLKPMPEGNGTSSVGDKAGKSGDGTDVASLLSPVDQGTETSPTSIARRASTTGTQTLAVPDGSPGSMPKETGKSPVVDEAKGPGDGSDATSPASLVDQGTVTSPTLEALGVSSTGSQTTSVTDSSRSMPKGTGTSPVGDEAKKSGESSDVASLSSSVDQGTETSSTSLARRASTTGTQTLAVPDGSPGSMPKETGNSPVGDEAEESGEGSDIASPASLVDQGTETQSRNTRGVQYRQSDLIGY